MLHCNPPSIRSLNHVAEKQSGSLALVLCGRRHITIDYAPHSISQAAAARTTMDKDPEGRGPRHSGPKDKGPKDHFTPRHYASKDTRGPLPFLNPTRRHLPLPPSDAKASPAVEEQQVAAEEEPTAQPAYHIWRSRDNRKGRHAIAVTEENAARSAIRPSDSLVESLKGLGKMLVRYPIWDVSYDVAMIYTLGTHASCIPFPFIDTFR